MGEQAGCKLFLGDRKGATPGLNVSDGGDWVHSEGRGQHGEGHIQLLGMHELEWI